MEGEPRVTVDPVVPPPPGTDTPVPSDATARAAAAGRARRVAPMPAPGPDRLVPKKALETRAEERARLRRERVALPLAAPGGVANPGAGLAPSGAMLPPGFAPAVAEAVPQRFVPSGWAQQPAAMPHGAAPAGAVPYGAVPYGAGPYAPGPYATSPYATSPYGRNPYGPIPYGPNPYGMSPYGPGAYPQVVVPPPRIRWTSRERTAAILSSWVGQTVMALATHLATAFFMIVGFAFLLHASGDEVAEFEADSFTSIVSLWSTPDRVWATVLIGVLVCGGILALGWLANALWARSAGLDHPHRSTWLAWLCTTAATGLVGLFVWPMALMGALFFVLASSSASLTVGSMWSTLFTLLGIAVVLTGGVGLLFGWLFLSTSRPRVDLAAIAAAEEAEARARDEAELTRVELRGEPSRR